MDFLLIKLMELEPVNIRFHSIDILPDLHQVDQGTLLGGILLIRLKDVLALVDVDPPYPEHRIVEQVHVDQDSGGGLEGVDVVDVFVVQEVVIVEQRQGVRVIVDVPEQSLDHAEEIVQQALHRLGNGGDGQLSREGVGLRHHHVVVVSGLEEDHVLHDLDQVDVPLLDVHVPLEGLLGPAHAIRTQGQHVDLGSREDQQVVHIRHRMDDGLVKGLDVVRIGEVPRVVDVAGEQDRGILGQAVEEQPVLPAGHSCGCGQVVGLHAEVGRRSVGALVEVESDSQNRFYHRVVGRAVPLVGGEPDHQLLLRRGEGYLQPGQPRQGQLLSSHQGPQGGTGFLPLPLELVFIRCVPGVEALQGQSLVHLREHDQLVILIVGQHAQELDIP